jgi:acyl-CoA dehydrogenase
VSGFDLVKAAERVGEDVAGPNADEVDQQGRFPSETIDELRRTGLLGALIPAGWGGPGASMDVASATVTAIAKHCAASGLILAMHHIQVATIVRHAAPATLDELLPQIAHGELLLASANSEVGLGGDRRTSICAVEPTANGFHLEKQASTVSYGEYADVVLATARRASDAPPSDQVLVICPRATLELEPTGVWDSLGLRGTCSPPCSLVADVPAHLVMSDYGTVFVRTALPVSAVLLSSVWLGIAEGAAARAHGSVRAQARKNRQASADAAPPPGALRLAELAVPLHQMRQVVTSGALDYERSKDTEEVEGFAFSSRMDNLKLSSSLLVVDITLRAMGICGLPGYLNGTPFSVGRMLRDGASAPLMVNNDRSYLATAHTLLARRTL